MQMLTSLLLRQLSPRNKHSTYLYAAFAQVRNGMHLFPLLVSIRYSMITPILLYVAEHPGHSRTQKLEACSRHTQYNSGSFGLGHRQPLSAGGWFWDRSNQQGGSSCIWSAQSACCRSRKTQGPASRTTSRLTCSFTRKVRVT